MKSFFSNVEMLPADPIFGLTAAFEKDERKDKVNLSIGVYKNEQGKIPVLDCVKQAEKFIIEKELTKNYLPIEGSKLYLDLVCELVLGPGYKKNHLAALQTIGGCGALRLASDFIRDHVSCVIHIPDLSWPNHLGIFSQSGLQVVKYPYYDLQEKKVLFDPMVEFFSKLVPSSVVLFHANCQNPTGADLSKKQWQILADVFQKKRLIALFDAAYLGFCQEVKEDAYPIRLFMEQGLEFFLALSFSKNFSLYAERTGCLCVFSQASCVENIKSQCKNYVRRNYSNPAIHGASIITTILSDPFLKNQWEQELRAMRDRIAFIRKEFVHAMRAKKARQDYQYFLQKNGLFSLCNFPRSQVLCLQKEKGIYLTEDGRINLAGLTPSNLSFVVDSMIAVGG